MNLIDMYMAKGIAVDQITVGTRVMVMKKCDTSHGPRIPIGTIGVVTKSEPCIHSHCVGYQRNVCKGYQLSVSIDDGNKIAHSCFFSFCTLEGIPIVFREE